MTSLSGLVSSYKPAMMEYDGSTGYYDKTGVTTSGNKVTMVLRFKESAFTGGGIVRLGACIATPLSRLRILLLLRSSDYATTSERNKLVLFVQDTVDTCASIISISDMADGEPHTVMASYDGDNGFASLIIDGANEDDTGQGGRVLTVGTLDTGLSNFSCGAQSGTDKVSGEIGFYGYHDAYLTNWSDFMHDNGTPKPLDEVSWTEWGGQPLFWNAYGDMENNLGSAGAMTKNGSITVGYGDPAVERVPPYNPAMMEFDGTGYYEKAYTPSGNKVTVVCRFTTTDEAADTFEPMLMARATYDRVVIYSIDSGWTADARDDTINVVVVNSAGTVICRLSAPQSQYRDGQEHTLFFSFDGDAGTAIFLIDGADADDVTNGFRVAPTTGTLDTGEALFTVGTNVAHSPLHNGLMGFVGLHDTYLTNWQDFMDGDGNPRNIEHDLSTVWGGTPLFWNATGYMQDNKGSAGNMQRNGNVVVADDDQAPLIPTYTPAMMKFDGSTGYYSGTATATGNKLTYSIRFRRVALTTSDRSEFLIRSAGTYDRGAISAYSSTYPSSTDLEDTMRFRVQNSSGVVICQLFSVGNYCDGEEHTLLASFDADAGTATFIIDGVDVDDTGNASRVAPTTGTLITGSVTTEVGDPVLGTYWGGEIGFVGYANDYLTNWSDFMQTDGNPKALDESTWTEWGAQPLFWNEHGDMENNLGSAGDMTKNGTIVVGKGGN